MRALAAAGAPDQGPPVARGLVLFGSILPRLSLVPVMDGVGVPSNFPPGPDSVRGFDRAGHQLFARTFADKLYNFYVFVPVDDRTLTRLHSLRLRVAGQSLDRVATAHGSPAASAFAAGPQRVRISWDASAFPRLACHDDAGGSPAPLMLEGDFTAADVRGDRVRCDFSDGVKTAFRGVVVPVRRLTARHDSNPRD